MKCFVPLCNNLSDIQNWGRRSNVKVTFHCFAKDSDARTLWLDILGIRPSVIPEKASICSIHFKETSFYTKSSYVRSRLSALPRLAQQYGENWTSTNRCSKNCKHFGET